MNIWEEDINEWDGSTYDDLFESKSQNLDDFENGDDIMDIEDIDFSSIDGQSSKDKFRKISRKTVTARIVPKKKRLTKEKSISRKIVAKKNVEYIFGKKQGRQTATEIKLPDNREVLIKGVDEFILSQGSDQVKNIGYYKGEKLPHLTLIVNNTTPNDIDIEFFNLSTPLDYMYSTSNNLNNLIKVAGDNKVSYSDMLFNLLANPTLLPNAKFTLSGPFRDAQFAQPMIFKNKNIAGYEKVESVQNSLNIDAYQSQNSIVYWDIEATLGRLFCPDGMDVMQYKVLAGMSVVFAFYYKQINLKKVFYPELRNKGFL
jgi:Fe-S cluster biosynthesis and repair protein YggX